jgi:uncharacterized protein with ATP-grasp and redox domains
MAKRIDAAICLWQSRQGERATARLPDFVSPRTIEALAHLSHIPYLPGRSALAPELKDRLQRRFTDELHLLTAQDWLPQRLHYILKAAWETVLVITTDFHLPYLVAEEGLHDVLQAAFQGQRVDIYHNRKEMLRQQIFQRIDEARRMISEAVDPLIKAMELALRGNSFGRAEIGEVLLDGHIIVERALQDPLLYHTDHTLEVAAKLKRKPLNIIYILDNAGESIWDLLLVEQLLGRGHNITLAGKSRPVINDETHKEIEEIIERSRFRHAQMRLVSGYNVPGIDLTRTPAALNFKGADLVILKGEGNFEGMPPDHEYSPFDLLYILKVKTQGLDHRLRPGAPAPEKNQGIVYLKRTEVPR